MLDIGRIAGRILCVVVFVAGAAYADFAALARSRSEDLRLSTYLIGGNTLALAHRPAARKHALKVLAEHGISKVYVEAYRGGVEPNADELRTVREFLTEHGYAVAAGIATVPDKDNKFGVRADRGLEWFNFQAKKTREDLKRVSRTVAEVFDECIVDDFLCTGDKGAESAAAKGPRTWGAYRRDLLTDVAQTCLIEPARAVNPRMSMLVKFPQWYDRFHTFGYDPERLPQIFDRVFVGTETRNAHTLRFGFTQPYEGFVNYRWLSECAGAKRGGAWFDFIECDGDDLLDQAYQTVLAGAQEIILFSYDDLAAEHAGHAKLRDEFTRLADLARAVRRHPVEGVKAYKPANSDPGDDMYLLDHLGMLGIPIVPCASPADPAEPIFLPAQAADDPRAAVLAKRRIVAGRGVVFTSGFLGKADDDVLCALAGVRATVGSRTAHADEVLVDGKAQAIAPPLGIGDVEFAVTDAVPLLVARAAGKDVPYLVRKGLGAAAVYVLNTHTYAQSDFDAVGEVLLSPKELGILHLPDAWITALRAAFAPESPLLKAPARVTMQPLGDSEWVLQNYNDAEVDATLDVKRAGQLLHDGFTNKKLGNAAAPLAMKLPARSHVWVAAR